MLAKMKEATSPTANPASTDMSFLRSSKAFNTTTVSSLIDRESSTTGAVVTAYTCMLSCTVRYTWPVMDSVCASRETCDFWVKFVKIVTKFNTKCVGENQDKQMPAKEDPTRKCCKNRIPHDKNLQLVR